MYLGRENPGKYVFVYLGGENWGRKRVFVYLGRENPWEMMVLGASEAIFSAAPKAPREKPLGIPLFWGDLP